MNDELSAKIVTLQQQLANLGKSSAKIAVAFSGGKDSFFLLKTTIETLGKEKVIAFFIKTPFSTGNDQKRINYWSARLDFHLEQLYVDVSTDAHIMQNPKDRCYFCKKKIFAVIKEEAVRCGCQHILDGTTFSDLDQYRPGLKALEEAGIISPLVEAGISSSEIIHLLRETLHAEEYYLTTSTCLATRFPYDLTLTPKLLETFSAIEVFFVEQQIYPVKIRYIEDGIRIETPEKNIPLIMLFKSDILDFCKKFNLKFITLDLEGIKSGAWD